ncbi:unnamed protein product [Owenia fusiformis]|uniref:Uncharacterized protein n=1 Tax=Owenia fusiformis TaxID=6347 RepID=A0A8J1V0H9_OWEFU|nr:unnamed protein product [Owenia fusiformis]
MALKITCLFVLIAILAGARCIRSDACQCEECDTCICVYGIIGVIASCEIDEQCLRVSQTVVVIGGSCFQPGVSEPSTTRKPHEYSTGVDGAAYSTSWVSPEQNTTTSELTSNPWTETSPSTRSGLDMGTTQSRVSVGSSTSNDTAGDQATVCCVHVTTVETSSFMLPSNTNNDKQYVNTGLTVGLSVTGLCVFVSGCIALFVCFKKFKKSAAGQRTVTALELGSIYNKTTCV